MTTTITLAVSVSNSAFFYIFHILSLLKKGGSIFRAVFFSLTIGVKYVIIFYVDSMLLLYYVKVSKGRY